MREECTFDWFPVGLKYEPEENKTLIVCMEVPGEEDWHLQLAHWYKKGSELDCVDKNGKEHHFTFKQDGFYFVQESSAKPHVYLMHGVKFWTFLPTPKIKPDDILTIE